MQGELLFREEILEERGDNENEDDPNGDAHVDRPFVGKGGEYRQPLGAGLVLSQVA